MVLGSRALSSEGSASLLSAQAQGWGLASSSHHRGLSFSRRGAPTGGKLSSPESSTGFFRFLQHLAKSSRPLRACPCDADIFLLLNI